VARAARENEGQKERTNCAVCLTSSNARTAVNVSGSESDAKPLLLERNEGELRTRHIHTDKSAMPAHEFMLKVSLKTNGSQHLVLGNRGACPRRSHAETQALGPG
jgi:hypothetical protein